MFHPEVEFNIEGAVLAGVHAGVTLGDEAFPEFAATALGHKSIAVDRAYAMKAKVRLPA